MEKPLPPRDVPRERERLLRDAALLARIDVPEDEAAALAEEFAGLRGFAALPCRRPGAGSPADMPNNTPADVPADTPTAAYRAVPALGLDGLRADTRANTPTAAYRAVPALGLDGLRADVPAPSLPVRAVLALAPQSREGCVAVPLTVEVPDAKENCDG